MLLDAVVKALPEGPRYFPKDQVTDQPERFLVAELIREQVLLATEQEVPYATTVVIEQYEEGGRLTRIAAAIYCEREGQKAILIGKQGRNLKKIGTAARLQIQSPAEHQGFSGAVRKGAAGLARFARLRPGNRLAHAAGAHGPGRTARAQGRRRVAGSDRVTAVCKGRGGCGKLCFRELCIRARLQRSRKTLLSRALYQGMTSVVPTSRGFTLGFSPCCFLTRQRSMAANSFANSGPALAVFCAMYCPCRMKLCRG